MKRSAILTSFATVLLLCGSSVVFANEFVPLSPKIPLVDAGSIGKTGRMPELLNAFLSIAIVISAILAVIMVAAGGFKYMTTDSVFQMGDSKEQITNAIVGLLIVITSILVLATINPDIVTLKLFQPGGYITK